ncbi:MAG: ATP-binding protein [Candidatus Promineifilaceae bacterium]
MKLWLKLTIAFLLVAVVGIVVVGYWANRTTESGFRHYLLQGEVVQTDVLAEQLVTYYRQQDGWDGVDVLLTSILTGRGQNGMGGGMWALADENGRIVAQSVGGRGRIQMLVEEGDGVALQMDGRTVGTLYLGMQGMGMGAAESQFLAEVNRGLLYGGMAAVVLALVLTVGLAQGLTRPLKQLTQATQALAGGDLSQQVPVTGHDEVATLAQSFNKMAYTLRQSETQRQQMLADIAHELRTPLAVMQGNLEAMLDGVFPLSPENLTMVHEETLLLRRLVDDLRTLSLAEAGQLHLSRSRIPVSDLIDQAVAAFAPLAEADGVALVAEVPDKPVFVYADKTRIQQVLANLLGNALRHAPQGAARMPKIWLRVQDAENGCVRIGIIDNGTGMSTEAAAHVFDRFWRADTARSRDKGGSGLGLAICQGIVAAHNGRIWVESQPNEGAAFWFELPAEA